MPILHNAQKALRVSKRKTILRQPVKSQTKTAQDAMRKEPTAAHLAKSFSAIDRAVKHHIFHKKRAARLKSQMAKLLATADKAAPVKAVKTAKTAKTAKLAK